MKEEDLTIYGRQSFMCEAYRGQMSTQIETKLIRQLQKMMKIMIIVGLLILVLLIKN